MEERSEQERNVKGVGVNLQWGRNRGVCREGEEKPFLPLELQNFYTATRLYRQKELKQT